MINLDGISAFFGQIIEQITIFSAKTAACTNLFTTTALILNKTLRLNIYITVPIIRLLLEMGFTIIMFTLLKLGPNLLPRPDMKHRQKWKFWAFSALNLRVGVVALSPTRPDETQPPAEVGGKSPHETRAPQPEDQMGPAEGHGVQRLLQRAIRYVVYRVHRV